ncbi:MAG: hypothetical protein K6T90_14195 [Leptolyngbyaceae cyanobacterium HOT.MB2.61]|jgi:hypothetical protein|nr:hypothetical protein [Leptolyngbyaceae cyanobacterium HOT.MB2.61]
MFECPNISPPKTAKELEQAIRRYRASNLKGVDLFCQWLAIRDASLEQNSSEFEGDRVPGEDSY